MLVSTKGRYALRVMLELAQRMRHGLCICPAAERGLWELSQKMNDVQGKKVYGYLRKPVKAQADAHRG